MFFGLFRSGPSPSTVALYAAIVSEARHTAFYARYGVPDTPTARFDMIILHLALLARRLRADPAFGAPLPPEGRRRPQSAEARLQDLIDHFVAETDRALREMGVGDVAVPKRMKKLASAWNGRTRAYDAALAAGDREALAAALARNVFAGAAEASGAVALAAHVVEIADALDRQPLDRLVAGDVEWPDPTALSPEISP